MTSRTLSVAWATRRKNLERSDSNVDVCNAVHHELMFGGVEEGLLARQIQTFSRLIRATVGVPAYLPIVQNLAAPV
jgi:hypothetical protein